MQFKFYLCKFLLIIASGIFLCAGSGNIALTKENSRVPNLVTVEIQAGIEKYIAGKTADGGGFFKLQSHGKEYLFKLVRVHTEYLSRLGQGRYFACVDMVEASGDVYDIDFFLAGNAKEMTVTETTLHKLNGIPYYTW